MTSTHPRRNAQIDFETGRIRSLVGELVSVKPVPAGQAVSYGGEYVTDCDTVLGLVGMGYADGIPRSATGASVMIGCDVFTICGRVAMDQVVVDLGPESAVPAGSQVEFWGERMPVATLAEKAGVPEVALTSYVGPRVEAEIVARIETSEDMEALGTRFASELRAGDAVVLKGELGAGKTTFTRGLGAALGARGTVQSPTFVIARTHQTDSAPLLHVDAYRLGEEGLIDDLDLDLAGSITVAEWGAPLTHAMPHWFDVSIERASGASADPLDDEADDPRTVRIRAGGSLPVQRLLRLTDGGNS